MYRTCQQTTGGTNVNETPRSSMRILSVNETADRLNIGRSTLYSWLSRRSRHFKPELPQPVHMGCSTGFVEHEIDGYIFGLMRARGGATEQ